MGLYDMTFQDVIRKNALFRPDEVALRCGDVQLTFGQYALEAARLASNLSALGVEKGDRIAVVAGNCHEYVNLYGAATQLGAIVLPINWRLKTEEMQIILEDATPKALIADPQYAASMLDPAGRCGFIRHRLVFGGKAEGFVPLADLDPPAAGWEPTEVSGDDPLVIVHTAAVHGKPRGAVISHGNLLAADLQAMLALGMTSDFAYLNMLPLFHIGGLGACLQAMHAGGRNIIMPRFDAGQAAALIEHEKVTFIVTFPPMLSSVLDEAERSGHDLSSLRFVVGLDHPDTMRRCQEVTGARYLLGYGQTETAGLCTYAFFDQAPGSAGREGHLARVRVVDDYDRPLPPGQPGEILVRGPIVFKGYWKMEEETANTFKDGWHHTGDVGKLDENGFLWYVKRKAEKELIKSGGENVYPTEVEKVLLAHPEIEEACVFGVPDREWGEVIKAVCVRKKQSRLQTQELIDFVADRIARYKKPKHVLFVSDLPKGEDGLLDRQKIKESFA
jgi:acyl-CoA synthetase (AMP-forming)/AMP-acid ligase II